MRRRTGKDQVMTYVYDFTEGDKDQKELLGGKGANLAEMTNLGLPDESVRGLAEQSQDERFAMDSYRRLLQMFGATVLGIESEVFSKSLERLKKERGTESDTDLTADDLRGLVD